MDIREKLVEMQKDLPCNTADEEDCAKCKYYLEYFCSEEMMADILIANGVPVRFCPHCRQPVIPSGIPEYAWQCLNCFEDFMDFECYKKEV